MLADQTSAPDWAVGNAERFWRKVEKTDGCWLWRGWKTQQGYGGFLLGREFGGGKIQAHRFAYTLLVGPVPAGLVLDHVKARGCTSKACVNPAHLEPVTDKENILRGDGAPAVNARRSECRMGHPLSGENLSVVGGARRVCRACHRAKMARLRSAKRAALVGTAPKESTRG